MVFTVLTVCKSPETCLLSLRTTKGATSREKTEVTPPQLCFENRVKTFFGHTIIHAGNTQVKSILKIEIRHHFTSNYACDLESTSASLRVHVTQFKNNCSRRNNVLANV